ncbi:MAG: thiamine diphosphokinase [Clostridia bacterium]|nr:thiamine diphosphokinase [Clostridia bacterium]
MSRCVIVGGAEIENYERLKQILLKDDYFIFCDSGLKHLKELSVKPNLIVGDFDSFKQPETDIKIIKLPHEKDDTDTFAAVKTAIKNGFCDFLIIGVIGQRLDHTIANVSMLKYLKNKKATAKIIDDYSEMFLLEKECEISKEECEYFSVIALSEKLEGLSIKGAKYELENAVIENSFQLGVSNEPKSNTTITLEKGDALIIKVF